MPKKKSTAQVYGQYQRGRAKGARNAARAAAAGTRPGVPAGISKQDRPDPVLGGDTTRITTSAMYDQYQRGRTTLRTPVAGKAEYMSQLRKLTPKGPVAKAAHSAAVKAAAAVPASAARKSYSRAATSVAKAKPKPKPTGSSGGTRKM